MKIVTIIFFLCTTAVPYAQVGIGTTDPQAQLDISNGTVRFSDYGTGTQSGNPEYLLGVNSEGDVVETDTDAIQSNNTGLEYYTWDISSTAQPNIDNVSNLGYSSSQGIHNGNLDDTARAAIAPDGDGYIIRYTGTIKVNNTGSFTFNAKSDDGTRIYVDNILVLENWYEQEATTTMSGTVTLAKGEHKIEFWYYENTIVEFMEFTWGANPDSYTVGSAINANQFLLNNQNS